MATEMHKTFDINGRLEFYLYESELWCKDHDGHNILVDATQTELIDSILSKIRECYPNAYNALREEYMDSAPNRIFMRYRMVKRFLKCNFGQLDSTFNDMDGEKVNFERVDCPLRQECKWDGVICSPLFKTTLSAQEMRIGKLFFEGLTKSEIAGMLYLSPETINNHIKNIYYKLGVHEKAEFMRYANDKNIFR